MNTTKHITRRGLGALLVLFAIVFLPAWATAQPRPDRRADRLTRGLDLTEEQVERVRSTVAEEAGPGALWRLAAALQPSLTDAQKEKLFAPPERRDGRDGPDYRQRGRRGPDEGRRGARREEIDAARKEALGLTDEQAEALDALREERTERTGPPPLPEEVAAILTPEQQEVAQIHHALARRLGPPRGMKHRSR